MSDETFKPTKADAANLVCGLTMGCADVIPGVSGGTVALILGIYRRLVTAISRVDSRLLGLLCERKWSQALAYTDARFLFALAAGIGSGVVGMSLLVNHLLSDSFTRALTFAAFFGMILASALLVGRLITADGAGQRRVCGVLGLAAAAVALRMATLPHHSGEHGTPSLWWLFCCGSVAICAMILPGISGAMILLVLGVYEHLTEVPKNLLSGQEVGPSLAVLVAFGAGCGISLILFSKLLRWLLARYQAYTMSILCGFMFGALPKLWPFQRDTTPEITKFKEKHFEWVWPAAVDANVLAVLVTAVVAALTVLAVDRFVSRKAGAHSDQTT